jgi:hypothetical protein
VLEPTLSEDERSQILQTIEMFEVITQTQKDDYQSLEILKVAYQRLGKNVEATGISRRLAEAYYKAGSFSLAMQECETVLVMEPNSPEMLSMLGEIESRLQEASQTTSETGPDNALTEAGYTAPTGGATASRLLEVGGRKSGEARKQISAEESELGNDQLGKFLIVQQMFSEDEVSAALKKVKKVNKALSGHMLAASLLDRLCKGDDEKMERVLSALIDRTKFAYVPLEYYDIDRQVVRMLPDELTLHRLFVPFDLISRTIMVAVCNPFDGVAREAVQQSLDYSVAWYLAKPATIIKMLQDIHKLEARA